MRRWATYLWRLLVALGEADWALWYWYLTLDDEARRGREFGVDLSDEASVRAAFFAIVEREWGAAGFQDNAPSPLRQPLPYPFWPFFPW